MKDSIKIELGGEKVTLRYTLGVDEYQQEYVKENDIKDPESAKMQRIMFALMEIFADDKALDIDDILAEAEKRSKKYLFMGVPQMMDVMNFINEFMEEADPKGNLKAAMEQTP